ncbi:CYTOCHROME P450 26 [Salix koriyanagi]|uniref:CYTOCHROME P450 26 n=1 Tax=Salix koriyanagi TaxID=2511006 RepID=A0A9Q0PUA6_9ROSI|nr:CYTOCHROME P450 26 [Salix koriyanagi]
MQFTMFSAAILVGGLCLLSYYVIIKTFKERLSPNPHLPPGSLGWPFIGETFEYLRTGVAGQHHRFVRDRMEKYDPQVFRTSLLGESMIVFCGPAGNKFLFRNENKLLKIWWPSSVRRLLKSSLANMIGDEAKGMRSVLLTFLDHMHSRGILRGWIWLHKTILGHVGMEGKQEVKVHPTVNIYTFEMACRMFTSIEDCGHILKLAAQFDIFLKGVISFAINIPGTRFHCAVKAADAIREELRLLARQRREALDKKMASPTQDLLSHLLVTSYAGGKFLSELEIVDNILLLLFASHDTTTSAITCVMTYLAELPEVYRMVLKEQLDIAKSKEPGVLLKWEDLQKMRYSCNVVAEVMRLLPPVRGGFREAIVDFTYAGYTIPKGSKLIWDTGSTHMDPILFPEAEEFDVSRFEGAGPAPNSYVPFGVGARICMGNVYARAQILVFLHNIVKRFEWDLSTPDEKLVYYPMPTPSQGLLVHLRPHQSSV